MRKFLNSIIISLLMISLGTGIVTAAEYTSNVYEKIVFDFTKGQVTSKNRTELEENIEDMNQYCEILCSSGEADPDTVLMYVILVSDLFSQEEYKAIVREGANVETAEDADAWRARLNEYTKAYHIDLYNENAGVFERIEYETIHNDSFSPYVWMTLNRINVTAEMLEQLASEECVAMVGVNPRFEAVEMTHDEFIGCSCICHSDGIKAVIWRILRFFYKIFGVNKTCECGKAHY